MIRSFAAPALAVLMLSLSGCLTAMVTESVREEGYPWLELADRPSVTGTFLGEEERGGSVVRVFEFPEALAGDPPRSLRVWVPRPGTTGPCGMEEITATAAARGDAVLTRDAYYREGDRPPSDRDAEVFDVDGDPFFVGIHGAGACKPGGWRDVAVVGGRREEFRSGTAWRGTCGTVDVEWVRRSRGRWLGRHALYPFAFALDVVTAPIWVPVFLLGGV